MNAIGPESMAEVETENIVDKRESGSPDAERHSCGGETTTPKGRGRSLSVATAHPSVETVVVKAKRAASSLWILLHSQSCVVAEGCPYPGCTEAKRLHLHLKTCSVAREGQVCCPTGYHGCEQARKLLAHYRRCRSIRARQAGQLAGRRESTSHHCLVCSLVARQARTMLDRRSSSPIKSASLRRTARPVVSTFMLKANSTEAPLHSLPQANKMPPPPPRRRLLSNKIADISAASSIQIKTNLIDYAAIDFKKKHLKTYPNCAHLPVIVSPLDSTRIGRNSGGDPLNGHKDEVPQQLFVRKRSSSEAEASSSSSSGYIVRRSRSASVGAEVSPVCETIEEEPGSDSSSRESVDKIEFNIHVSR